jgi:hypothetical protein
MWVNKILISADLWEIFQEISEGDHISDDLARENVMMLELLGMRQSLQGACAKPAHVCRRWTRLCSKGAEVIPLFPFMHVCVMFGPAGI